ncbi:hypothetical protein ACF0H5_019312 [Mactra antiquata]
MEDKKSTSGALKMFRRLSVFTNKQTTTDTSDRSYSMSQPGSRVKPDHDIWQLEQPTDLTSPLSIKRNNSDVAWTSSQTNVSQNLNENDADKEVLVTMNKGNDVTDGTHVNAVYKSEKELHGEYFVSAFGRKGRQIGEYQDAKHITCLEDGRLLVTDYVNNRLQICSNQNKAVTAFLSDLTPLPWASVVTKDNNIAVTVCKERCVKLFNQNGEFLKSFGDGYFICPTGIAVDKTGNFVICDSMNDEVCVFDNDGKFIKYLGKSTTETEKYFSKPSYVCVSVTGDIIVSDTGNHRIKLFNSNGDFIKSFGSFGKLDRQFKSPYDVCTNIYGDIFVADHYNNRIAMYTRDGVFSRHLVTSEHGVVHPQGLAITSDNYLYVTHGHLKASEILMFKLCSRLNYSSSDFISYV